MPRLTLFCAVLLGFVTTGCAQEGDLVLADDWVLVHPDDDPTEGVPADQAPCPRRAASVEAGALELDTAVCDWITVEAPSRLRVRAGTELELFFFHAALSANEPAEAVMEVHIGEGTTWTHTAPVPSSSAFYDEVLVLEQTLRPDDPLVLHVHNHGANTYTLGHVRTR